MLSASIGPGAKYYLNGAVSYYAAGTEATGIWHAPGTGSSLGIEHSAPIDPEVFRRLLDGFAPDGRRLAQNAGRPDRDTCVDFTFSAPKSVSAIWMASDGRMRRAVEDAHAAAVHSALVLAERLCVRSRRGSGTASVRRSDPGSLVGALFLHRTARPTERRGGVPDPQLHTHAVLSLACMRPDGTWGAIDRRALLPYVTCLGALYRAELAAGLRELGLSIRRTGTDGPLFEVAGVPERVIDLWSSRSAEIDDAMTRTSRKDVGARGTRRAALAARVRSSKSSYSLDELEDFWSRDLARLGLTRGGILEAALRAGREGGGGGEGGHRPLPEMVAETVERLTQTDSSIPVRRLIQAIAHEAVGVHGAEAVLDACREAVGGTTAVRIGTDVAGDALITSADLLAAERDVLDRLEAGRLDRRHLLSEDAVAAARRAAGTLSDEQAAAVEHACRRPGEVVVVEGAAGAGKSTAVRAIADAHRASGYDVLGCALAWHAAGGLAHAAGIPSSSLESLLVRLDEGVERLGEKTVIVLDEAGMVGTRHMRRLLAHVQEAGAKLLLVGDVRQLQPVSAGSALRLTTRVLGSQRIDTVRRQREPWLRDAGLALAAGNAADALEAFRSRGDIRLEEGRAAALSAVVELWASARDESGDDVLVLAPTRRDVRDLNATIRSRLRQAGAVGAVEVVVRGGSREEPEDLRLSVGDRLRFTAGDRGLGVRNGDGGRVLRIEGVPGRPSIVLDVGGRELSIGPERLVGGRPLPLRHSYATTVHAAQGATVEQAVVLLSSDVGRELAYVAASRSRGATRIVVDAAAERASIRDRRPIRERRRRIEDDEVLLALVSGLSRSTAKPLLVEVAPRAVAEAAVPAPRDGARLAAARLRLHAARSAAASRRARRPDVPHRRQPAPIVHRPGPTARGDAVAARAATARRRWRSLVAAILRRLQRMLLELHNAIEGRRVAKAARLPPPRRATPVLRPLRPDRSAEAAPPRAEPLPVLGHGRPDRPVRRRSGPADRDER